MSKKREYIKNTLILLLGKFATQFISLLLLPIFTHYLKSSDYGLIDLYQTYVSLIVPVSLLCLDSAIFRFLIDVRNNEDGIVNIVTTSIKRLFINMIFVIIISLIIGFLTNIKYFTLIVADILVLMISNVMLQICRGLGKNQVYSIGCIITGITNLALNLFLIVILHYGANSILIANIFANIFCSLFVFITSKIYRYIKIKMLDKKTIKKMLNYSIPLIPNALSWWIVNVSDRTIISLFINTAANGIYTVSCKFSNILNSVFSIFTMSWQESASLHINDEDRDVFFSQMIQNIYKLFVFISVLILILVCLFFNIIVGEEYISSYNYIPILILANSFNVLIGLFGGIYIAKKLTKKMTTTTLASSILNLIINLIFIKKYGLYAASFSTLIAYFIMSIYRYFDIQKYVRVKISLKTIFESLIMFTLSFICFYCRNFIFQISIIGVIFVFVIINNHSSIIECVDKIKFKKINK